MTQQIINVGNVANDGQGDTLRAAFIKSNDNFTELYGGVSPGIINGTSNVKIVSANGNVSTSVAGTSNVMVVSSNLVAIVGNLTVSGNLSAVNLVINNIASDDSSFITIEDGVNINGEISATGNITAGNLSAVNLVINNIASDDSSFITIEDGVNINGGISATGNVTGGNILTDNIIKTTAKTFATLPAAVNIGAGARSFITDANTATFGSQVTSGGANAVPVWTDGTNWYVG